MLNKCCQTGRGYGSFVTETFNKWGAFLLLALLRSRSLARRLLTARALSVWGDTFYAMAAMWVTLELTGSAWRMALIAAAEVAPFLLFSAAAGVLADRWERRRLLVTLDLVQAAVVGSVPLLALTGHFSPWLLPVIGFVLASCRTLYGPALNAYMAASFDPADRPAMLGMLALVFRSGSIIVPLLQGVAFRRIELVPAFLADSASFVASAAILASLPRGAAAAVASGGTGGPERGRFVAELKQGIALLRPRRLLLITMFSCTLGSLVSAPIYRFGLPLLADGALGAGEGGFQLLQFAKGVGGVGGSLLIASLVRRSGSYARTTLLAWTVTGLSIALLSAAALGLGHAGMPLAMLALAVSMGGLPVAYSSTNLFVQAEVPSEHVGKASALYSMLDMSGDYGGVLIFPVLLTWFRPEAVLAAGGVMLATVCITALVLLRPGRRGAVEAQAS